jgi:integrase/recombinase XerD
MIGDEELVELGLRLMEGAESEAKGTERQRAIAFRDGMLIALLRYGRRCGDGISRRSRSTATSAESATPGSSRSPKMKRRPASPWSSLGLRSCYRASRIGSITGGRCCCDSPGGGLGPAGNALWVSSDSSPLTQQAIYDRVTERTRAAFGKSVNPHLFRDCAATTLAYANPKHVGITAALLGHRSFATTERYYLRARMAEARLVGGFSRTSCGFAMGAGVVQVGRHSNARWRLRPLKLAEPA